MPLHGSFLNSEPDREAGDAMMEENRKEHQVVMASPSVWYPDLVVYAIHVGPLGSLFGYCDIGDLTFLVREEGQQNLWQIVGFVRP